MTKALAAATISLATICKALHDLEEAGIPKATTPQVGEILLRPQNYDMGGRLYGLTKSTKPAIAKEQPKDSGSNVYFLTDYGREYLTENLTKIQSYGNYALVGIDKKVKRKTSGAALQALTELQGLIDTNTEVKAFIQHLCNQIDGFMQKMEEKNGG